MTQLIFLFFHQRHNIRHPSTHSATIKLLFISFAIQKGKEASNQPAVFIFLFWKGEMGKCHDDCLSQEAKTSEKNNSMLSFLTYMYQKTILKTYLTQNGIYVWCTTFGVCFQKEFFSHLKQLRCTMVYNTQSLFWARFFLLGTVSMYGV